MLEYKSEANQSKLKLGHKTRHQASTGSQGELVGKLAKQIRNEMKFKSDARKKEERGVKMGSEWLLLDLT